MGAYGDGGKKGKGKAATAEGATYDAPFRGYINVNLSEDQKAGLDAWLQTDAPWRVLETMAAAGVAVAVKIDARSGGFIASGTQRNSESDNAGLCVTSRGKSAQVALWRLIYTLAYLSTSGRWEDVQPMADPDRW